MNNVLITHNDLDGVGCTIIFNHIFGPGRVFNIPNGDVTKTILNVTSADILVIADVTSQDVQAINHLNRLAKTGTKIYIFDHHRTAEGILKKITATGVVFDGENCATKLMHEHFLRNSKDFKALTEHINEFDASVNRDPQNIGFALNSILQETGIAETIKMFSRLRTFSWTPEMGAIVISANKKIENALKKFASEQDNKTYEISGLKVVFADGSYRAFMNEIVEQNNNIDMYIFLNNETLSIRRGTKKLFNCNEIAQLLNGGGHPYSGGAPYPPELISQPKHIIIGELSKIIKNFLDNRKQS